MASEEDTLSECVQCEKMLGPGAFPCLEHRQAYGVVCHECRAANAEASTLYQCCQCLRSLKCTAFKWAEDVKAHEPYCLECYDADVGLLVCGGCKEWTKASAFH